MCSDPQLINGLDVACRRCDDCVNARKSDWVARAMAEKASSGATFLARLSYRNKADGTKPLGAKAFKYSDVQRFFKAVREAYFRRYEERGGLRYIVAGEYGSKKGRVHYHVVLFTDRALDPLGTWSDFLFKPMEGLRLDQDIHWSLWPHGTVHVQKPDQFGMAYAIKYALKDQMNIKASKGSGREIRAERFSAGLFRMSKMPPIGDAFLQRTLAEWEENNIIPAKPYLAVPELSGFWWPVGRQREKFLLGVSKINQQIIFKTGRESPHFAALLNEINNGNSVKDYENVFFGEQEAARYEDAASVKRDADAKAKGFKRRDFINATIRKCGNIEPCADCSIGLTVEQSAAIRWAEKVAVESNWKQFVEWAKNRGGTPSENDWAGHFLKFWREKGQPSGGCLRKDTDDVRGAFSAYRSARGLQRTPDL